MSDKPRVLNVRRAAPPAVIARDGKRYAPTGNRGHLRQTDGRGGGRTELVYEYALFAEYNRLRSTWAMSRATEDRIWADVYGNVLDVEAVP